MKKKFFLFILLALIVSGFIIYDLKLTDQSKSVLKNTDNKIEITTELLIFHFQPSMKENTEVIIDFNKKYLVFKTIYPFYPEPAEPTRKDGTNKNFIELNQPIQSYYAKLQDEDLSVLKMIINKISKKDFQRVEGTYIDGSSYNFSILSSNNKLENGFIAQEKTLNQEELVFAILNLLKKTNKFEENTTLISYYYKNN